MSGAEIRAFNKYSVLSYLVPIACLTENEHI